jgi:protein ImuB
MYACIHIPNFLVQAILRAEPALRAEAVAITDGKPPLCRVVALNNKAARGGIKPGISKLEAAQFPEVTIRQRSPAQEQAAHAALLDLGFAFSPRVEATAPDTVVLDLAGLEHLFGVPETIASNLKRGASALRLKANVAVAANVDAAVHAGRWLRGVSVIPEGNEPELLGSLPLEVLAPQLEILETLDRWGVRTFHALAALPSAQLSQRLGQEGLRLQALARGRTSRPLVPVEPALKFEEAAELEYPVTLLEPLAFILGRMLDQLSKRLEGRSLATHELRLRLELENQGSVTCESSIAEDNGQRTTDSKLRTLDRELEASLHAPNMKRPCVYPFPHAIRSYC